MWIQVHGVVGPGAKGQEATGLAAISGASHIPFFMTCHTPRNELELGEGDFAHERPSLDLILQVPVRVPTSFSDTGGILIWRDICRESKRRGRGVG